jgi:hypothetical protein
LTDIAGKIEAISGTLANMGVAANNAIQSMGGLGLSMSNLLEFGNKINVSLVGAERTLALYGKTADGIAASTANLSRQFSLPYEDLLKIQQDLAMNMPVAITGQEKIAAVVQFAGDRFGMTSEAIKAYMTRLEDFSQKTRLAYEDQLLMIDAADKLKAAQRAGAADVDKLSDSLMRQGQITKANAEMMYAMNEINRDQLASIMRTTEGLSEQAKNRLGLAETATRASNVLANESKIMYSMMGNIPAVQEFVKGLTLAPGAATAEMMKKMTSGGYKGVSDLDVDTEGASALKKELSADTIASFEQLFAKGMDLSQAKSEMMKAASEGGEDAKAVLEYMLDQKDVTDALDKMEKGRINTKLAQEKMEQAINTAMRAGVTAELASMVTGSLRLQTLDRLRLAQEQLTDQAKVHGDVVTAINEAYTIQAEMLGKISGIGGYIGDQSANDSEYSSQMKESMERQVKAKAAIAEIEATRLGFIQRGQIALQNPEDRKNAAKELQYGFEETVKQAQKLIDAEKDPKKREAAQQELDQAKLDAKKAADAVEKGNADQVLTMLEKQRQKAISASNDVTKTIRDNNKTILDASVARFNKESEYRKSEVSQIEAQLSLMDSVASGIGASAEMRAAAVQTIGEQISTTENEMAALTKTQQDFLNKAAEAEQKLVKAQADGKSVDIEAANREIMAFKEAAADAQKKLNEADTARLGLIKQQLEMTKQIREGYLDALSSMMEGAGVFAEIVVDQEKNLGTLLRTAKDMPTSLRTGAADGRGAEMSTFGVGGIQAGEWSRDMASYTNELVSSQMPEITDYLKQIAGRATGDVASLNADRMGAAMDQTAAAGGAAGSVVGTPPAATPAAAATSSTAGASASTGQPRLDDSVVDSISSQVAAMEERMAKEQTAITDYLKQIAGMATGGVASLIADRMGAAMDWIAAAGGAAGSVVGTPPAATPAAAATSSTAGASASTGQLRLDDSVVDSISSQVAAMAKEQVVPAIIDGFAMAMKTLARA